MSGGPRGTPPPLDLKAVDREVAEWWEYVRTASVRPPADALERIEALLAHVRALRAALLDAQEWAAGYPLGGGTDEVAARQVYEHAAAVLAAAQDGESL